MPDTLQLFISTPGDVIPERRRAQLVIEKLAKTYARFFRIEPILWELETMLASGHFQDQITPPSETDIVVLIVWSRLGTPLPPKTETREYRGIDGRVPVTGTEWEFEDALASQKRRGAPDLLAYRKQADPTVSLRDKAAKAQAEDQWDKLETFWSRWFLNRGQFRAAFNEFTDLDDFERRLEHDLKNLIERRIKALRAKEYGAPAATWYAGSPFRGLESYRFEHAPIFFGRSAMIRAAVERVTSNAERGRAFLLLLGASGVGKSSLAQAGVLPALTARGIVPEVGLWRRSVLSPSGHSAGPFMALAEALLNHSALPELLSPTQDASALARHLRAAADDPAFAIVGALDHAEAAARKNGELLLIEKARLALVVDQFEELFTTAELTTEDRLTFVRCLEGLARSGRVFVLATMRSDQWHRAAGTPLLVEMASGDGRLDLLPPTQDEIMEMIRQPAEAAGLSFDSDPARDIRLDATLAAEAAGEAGALPLLSFLLDELYKKDVEAGGGRMLTYASAKALGGLKGAIANRAEAVFDKLPVEAQAVFPRVLRAFVTVSRSGAEPTSRTAPMERFAPNSPERVVVDALLDPQTRLLVAEGDGAGARVRLAHEALITNWERAKRQLAQERDDLRTRAMVEEAFAEWSRAANREKRRYLLRDPLLANAVDLVHRWATEFDPLTCEFVEASRRRGRLRQQLTTAAAIVFAIFAVAASVLGLFAAQQQRIAEERLQRSQIAESRFAAEKALSELDPELAVKTVLQGAPLREGERPFEESNWKALVEVEARRPGLRIVRRFYDEPRSISWDPAGTKVAATDGVQLAVWDASTGRRLFAVADSGVSAEWSPDGTLLASTDGLIRSSVDGHVTAQISKNNQNIRWASRSPPQLLAITRSGVASIFSAEGKKEADLSIDGAVKDAMWSADAMRIVAVTTDGVIHTCDAETGRELIRWPLNESTYEAVTWSTDGKLIATVFDKKVVIWDANEGKKITEIATEYTQRIRFSTDGSWLMIAGYNGITLNDTRNGRQLNSISVHANDAALSPDDRLIGVASSGGVYEWEPLRARKKWLRLNSLAYDHIAWSPDSLHLAASAGYSLLVRNKEERTTPEIDIFTATSGWEIPPYTAAAVSDSDRDKKVPLRVIVSLSRGSRALEIYDLITKRRLLALSKDGEKIQRWFWKQDGTRLAIVFEDGALMLWSAIDKSEILMQGIHKDVTSIWWGSGWLLTRAKDNSERIWLIDTQSALASYRTPSDSLPSAFWHQDLILVRPEGEAPILWDVRKGERISVLKTADPRIERVFWGPTDRQLVSVPPDGLATLWDLETGTAIFSWPMQRQNLGVSWSPKGDRIVTISENQTCAFREASTGNELARFNSCWSVDWSPDGRRALIGSEENAFFLDASSGQTLQELKSEKRALGWEAAWDPTGSKVLATYSGSKFYVLKRQDGSIVREFSIPEPWIVRGIWDEKGERVTVFSGDRIVSAFGNARVFDITTGREIAVLRGHEKNILGGRWDPSGAMLLTWSQDTTARIWDVGASRELALLAGHGDFVLSGEWSKDGGRVTTRYAAPPPYTWNVRPFELERYARIDWLRSSLGITELPESTDYRSDESSDNSDAAVCEKGAENPVDPARRGPGVQIEEIKPDEVIPVCEKALSQDPQNGRLNYLLGRANVRAHNLEKAYAAIEKAASLGYTMALVDLGAMLLDRADSEHYAPDHGVQLLEKAAHVSPIAYVIISRFFESTDRNRAADYLNKAIAAGKSHAYQWRAEQAERGAQAASNPDDADDQWLQAFRNWSIAYNISQKVEKRGAADWEFPLARRAALAWHLAEHGRTLDVVRAYRESMAIIANH